ncbi:MAG: sugar ABC transporter permease [Spirochaetales bacterium]|nr:sugar ABC transporter permease [Spirochaetales bacterium]MBO4717352.1 sugar ABC transporter permease [Spirochaetales bacterium]MBR5099302.1 sugar ABC transporter permease [Spirochaetales bacterium]
MQNTISFRKKARARWGVIFVIPTCVVLFVFVFYPICYTLVLSLNEYNFAYDMHMKFVGLKNFVDMFKDIQFLTALKNTLQFTLFMFVILVVLSLSLALLLFNKKRRSWLYRVSIFMPIVVPASLICILFSFMLADNFGIVNKFLVSIGLSGWSHNWLTDAKTARVWVIIVSVWGKVGFCTILFLSGLQNISQDMFEAAEIDGAVGWKKLIHIMIPNLTETFVVVGIWAILQCLKLFVTPNVLTKGGPANATLVMYQNIYNTAFNYFDMGYAAAQAFVLTALVMIFSLLNMKLSKGEN